MDEKKKELVIKGLKAYTPLVLSTLSASLVCKMGVVQTARMRALLAFYEDGFKHSYDYYLLRVREFLEEDRWNDLETALDCFYT